MCSRAVLSFYSLVPWHQYCESVTQISKISTNQYRKQVFRNLEIQIIQFYLLTYNEGKDTNTNGRCFALLGSLSSAKNQDLPVLMRDQHRTVIWLGEALQPQHPITLALRAKVYIQAVTTTAIWKLIRYHQSTWCKIRLRHLCSLMSTRELTKC